MRVMRHCKPRLSWLGLALLAFLASGCATTATFTAADTAAVDRLLGLIRERLDVAPEVARTKWNTEAPIEDLPREKQIIDEVAKAGARPVDADQAARAGRRSAGDSATRRHIVQGVDLSEELIDVARRSIDEAWGSVSFEVGDIQQQPAARYDAILCRGVLNDFVEDEGREGVFATFARALRPSGVLILDVREWEASAVRKDREPIFRKSVDTDRGRLTFTSVTELDRENRRLLLSERHTLVDDGQERSSDYQFVMRCWTREELQSGLAQGGFGRVVYFGAYDAAVDVGSTDRLVAVAQLSQAAA